ncbi:S-adenosyl-L-methionine-dependent methyltransferase [Crassisporium funariophilum]|nr:S-adenosyl-L-methionine-dependent methyltransferase [Crassisporium funariophilum]
MTDDTPQSVAPRTREVDEPEMDGHVSKKPRLGDTIEDILAAAAARDEMEKLAAAAQRDVEPPVVDTVESSLTGGPVSVPDIEDTTMGDSVMIQLHDQEQRKPKSTRKKRRRVAPLPEACSPADVLQQEIRALIGGEEVDAVTKAGKAFEAPYTSGDEVVVTIDSIGSGVWWRSQTVDGIHEMLQLRVVTGSGLAKVPKDKGPWVIVVPFALPGETVRVKVGWPERMYSNARVLEMLVPNTSMRDDSLVQCKYFGKCAGCQYQMLSSETQLDLKRDVVVKAYKTYSNLPESSIPVVDGTVESPLLYGYRTKFTPHFGSASQTTRRAGPHPEGTHPPWLKIGFNEVNTSHAMDIEDCPIAMDTLNEKYGEDRKHIIKNILSYKKGVSLNYRDSLDTTFDAEAMMTPPIDRLSEAFTKHIVISDQKSYAREMVGDFMFEYVSGGFFQNNNSIMPLMIDHVRQLVQQSGVDHPTHLVDTYCGSGLFGISLHEPFQVVAGIELSSEAIQAAKRNAALNRIPSSKISFLAGDAQNIFSTVGDFPPSQTVVVIDPPRKGCDEMFLEQLLRFRAKTVVYARDVGTIVGRTEGDGEGRRYRVESLRGFDLFPQTAHVESVALLRLY